MASIPGSVRLTGFIAPTDSTDTFPVFKPIYGLGGLRSVASLTERDAITTQRREPGMIVYVSANTTFYTLGSGLTNSDWTIFSSGSGSGNFLPISGGTVTGSTTFSNGLSANTFSGGTLFSGSTDLYQIFAPFGVQSGSYNQEGSNIITGGTNNNQIISIIDSPSFNNIYFSGSASGFALSANTIYSGSTDLSDIFALYPSGSGTQYFIPLWGTSSSLTNSSIYQDPATGITIYNNVSIVGDFTVLGTAFTVNTETVQSSQNLIVLNYSGTNISAIGGGILVVSGQTSGSPSTWIIDNFGNWSANTQIIAGGGLNVNTGTTLSSGGTDLYNIFVTQDTPLGFSGWTASTGLDSIVANNGTGNVANGQFSIIGGRQNKSNGYASLVGNGKLNTALTSYSIVVGGYKNISSDYGSFIGGGTGNTSNGLSTFVGGGFANSATTKLSTIGGGARNLTAVYANYATIGGGQENYAHGYWSVIAGGLQNRAMTHGSVVGGGRNNLSSSYYSTVAGGQSNSATTGNATVAGGSGNLAGDYGSVVGGGRNNVSNFYYSVVAGGYRNKVYGTGFGNYSSIVGGKENIVSRQQAFLGGGLRTSVSEGYSSLVGGVRNFVSGPISFLGGGYRNAAIGNNTFVGGGRSNSATTNYSSIVGGWSNVTSGNFSSVLGGLSNTASGVYSAVVNGRTNLASADASAIIGGTGHTVTGRNSAIIGGGSISGVSDDTVYIPNARLAEIPGTVIYSAGTPIEQIFTQSGTETYAITLTGISASTTYTITHNLNSTDIIPALWNETTGDLIYAKVTNRLINTVDVYFTSSPGADVRVIIKK